MYHFLQNILYIFVVTVFLYTETRSIFMVKIIVYNGLYNGYGKMLWTLVRSNFQNVYASKTFIVNAQFVDLCFICLISVIFQSAGS